MVCTPTPAGGPPISSTFQSCLRKCPGCRVGYSNARNNPTLIWEDPLFNVPASVRKGVRETIEASINVRNRENKLVRFGYSTSEDAVTWTFFSFLHGQHQDKLPQLYETLFGIKDKATPALLLWGSPVPDGPRERSVRDQIITISNTLTELPNSRTEPDVVLDFGKGGLVIIEVKYRSGNDSRPTANWYRYLPCNSAFRDSQQAQTSGLYELVRNWRFAHDLSGGRPFVVANLAPEDTFKTTPGLTDFENSLAISQTRRFLRLSWNQLICSASQAVGGLPDWLNTYLVERGLQ